MKTNLSTFPLNGGWKDMKDWLEDFEAEIREALQRDFFKGARGDHMAYQRCVIYREILGE